MLVRSKKIKPANDKKVSEYKSELEKIKRRRDRLLDLYLSEGITKEDYSSKADELTRREAFLSDELKRLCPAIPTGLTAEVVLKKLKEYANSANADSPQYKRRLLSTYVDRITVSNERIVIYFKFTVPGLGDSVEKEFGDYFVRSKSQTLLPAPHCTSAVWILAYGYDLDTHLLPKFLSPYTHKVFVVSFLFLL